MRLLDSRAYAVYGRLLVETPQVTCGVHPDARDIPPHARGVHSGARDIPTDVRGVQPTSHRGFTVDTPRTNSSE